MGAELFHVDRQTDGQTNGQTDRKTNMTKLIVIFRNFAKASKNYPEIRVRNDRVGVGCGLFGDIVAVFTRQN